MKDEKNNINVEELEKEYEEVKKTLEKLDEQLTKAKQEEEERKLAQLALEQDARKKEVDDAFEYYIKLRKAYIKDYGSYTVTRNLDDNIFPNPFWRSFF